MPPRPPPTQRIAGIVAQAFGLVDVFVRKPPKHGLPQQPDQRVAAVPAGAGVSERTARPGRSASGKGANPRSLPRS